MCIFLEEAKEQFLEGELRNATGDRGEGHF